MLATVPWALLDGFLTIAHGIGSFAVIAWLLKPADVGLAMTAISIQILVEAFSAAGIQEALVQGRSFSYARRSTALSLSLLLSVGGYAACLAGAAVASALMQETHLVALAAVAALTLPVNAAGVVHLSYLKRRLRAQALTLRLILTKATAASALLCFALMNFGPWSLVISGIAASVVSTASLFFFNDRAPRFGIKFDPGHAASLLRFGALVSAEAVIWALSVRTFIIIYGVWFGSAALGHLLLAMRLIDEISRLLQSSLSQLGLSYFSALERSKQDLGAAFTVGTSLVYALAAPIFLGLAIISPGVFALVFPDDWRPSQPIVQILAIGALFLFPRMLVGPAIRATGDIAPLLRLSLATLVMALLVAATGPWTGPIGTIYLWAARDVVALVPAILICKLRIGFSWLRLWSGMAPSLLGLTALLPATLLPTIFLPLNMGTLLISILSGFFAYAAVLGPFVIGWLRRLRS